MRNWRFSVHANLAVGDLDDCDGCTGCCHGSVGDRRRHGAAAWVDWPQFRGIRASGIADGRPTPVKWDVATRKSIAWKTPVPGLGLSSPIAWGDLVCHSVLSTPAISEGTLIYRTLGHVLAIR